MAEGTIDSLSIEIGASSKQAAQNIKNVANAMKSLKEAVTGLKLGDFKKDIGKIGASDYKNIERLAKALGSLKGISINGKIADNMLKIADACELIQQKHINRLAKFNDAMKGLKGVSTRGYDKLPAALLNIAAAVDRISDSSIARVERLTKALGKLKGVDVGGIGTIMRAQNEAWRIQNKIDKQRASDGAKETQAEQESGKTVTDITEAANEAKNFIGSIGGWLKQTVRDIAGVGKDLAGSVLPGIKEFAKLLNTARSYAAKLAKSMMSVAKSAISLAKSGIKTAFSGLSKGLKTVFDHSPFKKLENSFGRLNTIFRSLGRIAFYRAIRSAIKAVTQAFSEGAERAYWYARQYGDATKYIADAYDNLSSKSFTMSNQLGAAWATLIATIEPIILRIISLVTQAANAITQLFALLGGKSTYLKAVDYNKQWADSAGGAAKAAKEWRNQLMGFDEINRLDEPSDGGGGGGGANTDYGNMFEEAPISDWMQDIKDAFDNGQWAELGKLLGEKFNEIINSVKWDELGKKIGTAIRNAVTTAYTFLNTADFKNLGNKIAELLNNAGDSINWKTLGRLSMRLSTALWDVIYGAVVETNWHNVAVNIGDFFIGSLDEFSDWVGTLSPEKVAKSITDFFDGLKEKKEQIGEAIKRALKAAFDFAVETAGNLFPDKFGDDIKSQIEEKLRSIGQTVGKFTMALGAILLFSGVAPLKGIALMAVGTAVTAASKSAGFEDIKGNIENGLRSLGMVVGASLLAIGAILTFSGVAPLKGIALMAMGTAVTAVSVDWGALEAKISEVISSISGGLMLTGAAMAVIGMILAMTGNFPLGIGLLLAGASVFTVGAANYDWDALGNKIDEKLEDIKTNVSTKIDTIKSGIIDKWTKIKSSTEAWWELVKQTISNSMTNSETDVRIGCDSILGDFDVFASGVWEKMHSIGQTIRTWVQYAMGWLSSLISQLNNLAGNPAYSMWDGGHSSLIPHNAEGGFPEDGLFMANHGELVGKFSNGKTAVANNEQITAGIANAVYGAFMSAFSQTGGNSNNSNRPIVLNINGREFARVIYDDQQAVAREHGSRLVVNGVGA